MSAKLPVDTLPNSDESMEDALNVGAAYSAEVSTDRREATEQV
ncbi:hypothetical protein B0G71_0706 [Paraburkholderia sp. BL27I4N3]|nr:hypothetical protein B0G71_0706 [Paraburkholderia sp. BL27I4N3]